MMDTIGPPIAMTDRPVHPSCFFDSGQGVVMIIAVSVCLARVQNGPDAAWCLIAPEGNDPEYLLDQPLSI